MSSALFRKYLDIINERVTPNDDGTMSGSINPNTNQTTAPADKATVNRDTGMLEYQGQEYTIIRITPNGPQPRIPGGVRTKVSCPDMGVRCLGSYDVVLYMDKAYVYMK